MLGMFHLLPLLKGWEYKRHKVEREIVMRGADPIEQPISETGWLISLAMLTDDCYGTLRLDFQGADLETQTSEMNAEGGLVLGAIVQDPMGWVQRYFRPNPASTAGIFFFTAFSGGAQGAIWPYVPVVKASIYLSPESTQPSAYISASTRTIAVTDSKAFLVSLRKILGIKGKIDPKLFALGPLALEEEE